jgi:dTDP-4-dehydrorhamnose reductase
MDLKPIPTSAYTTLASRPAYSVLDKTKIKNTFNIGVNEWKTSLVRSINLL